MVAVGRLPPRATHTQAHYPHPTGFKFMKRPLITRFKTDFLGQVFSVLNYFEVYSNDEVEVNIHATKQDVKIVFRIIKGAKDKKPDNAA